MTPTLFQKELKATLVLALPVIGAQLGQMSMGFVDTVMVGRLGPEALAGVALGNTLFFVTVFVCLGVIQAVGPMVSQAFGAGDEETISRTVRQGMWMALALTIPSFGFLWNADSLLIWMGQDPATVALTQGYLHAIVWGIFPFLVFGALRSFVEGVSKPLPVTIITFLALGLNILSNYVLMFGKWGFPALGLVGTGWATSIVYTFMALVMICFLQLSPLFSRYRVFSRLRRPDPRFFAEIFRIGWPIGASYGIEGGLFSITALLIGLISTVELAAHQIAIQCAAYTFMVPMGIGIASSVRVGQSVGRGMPQAARRAGFSGILLAFAFMTCTAVVFWIWPAQIVSLYLDVGDVANQEVVQISITLLGVAAVFQVFDGVQVASSGALRGLKDTRTPMLLAFFSYWGIGLVSGYLLGFYAGGNAVGLWWGLVLGLAAASVLLTLRFHRMTRRLRNI